MRRELLIPVALLAGISAAGGAVLGPTQGRPAPVATSATSTARDGAGPRAAMLLDATSAAAAPAAAPAAPSTTIGAGELLGVVLARESVDVAAQLDGRLTSVRVRLGDRVRKGQLLATLDARALRSERAVALAALQAAHVDEERAAIELEQSRARLDRMRPLAEEGTPAISGDELERASYQEKLAASRLRAARAQAAERRAQAHSASTRHAEAEIRAPFDGVVAARYVDPGARIASGTPIVRVLGEGELRVRFAVPAERQAELAIGGAVRVRVPELAAELPGALEKLAPEVDAASRMIIAEARIDVPEPLRGQVLAGRSARVALPRVMTSHR